MGIMSLIQSIILQILIINKRRKKLTKDLSIGRVVNKIVFVKKLITLLIAKMT